MESPCSRANECVAKEEGVPCAGCGFPHYERILKAHSDNKTLESIGREFFECCSKRKGPGARASLDKPIRQLFKKIKGTTSLEPKERRGTLRIDGRAVPLQVKCDGAFRGARGCFFYEVKGYGDNTNDVLSAITAATAMRATEEFKCAPYYYIGVVSGRKGLEGGLSRDDFLDPKRRSIAPYVMWAENMRIIKFYGIVDIDVLLDKARRSIT